MPGEPMDLKKAVHPKGGGMNVRDVKHGGPTASTPTTTASPKKVAKRG